MNRSIVAHTLFALTTIGLSTACSDSTSGASPATAGTAGQASTGGGSSFGGSSSGGAASGGAASGGAASGGAASGGAASGGAASGGAAASGGVGGMSSGGTAGTASGGASTGGAGTGGAGGSGGATCDRTGLTSASQVIDGDATAGTRVVFADAYSSDTDPFDYLGLEIYEEFGATIGSQSFSFSGENYATCGVCLLGGTVCEAGTGCQKTFMAQSGELEITALTLANGESFAASLTNATLAEVTIDDQTNTSTLVPNGETWCVPSFSWSGPLSVQ